MTEGDHGTARPPRTSIQELINAAASVFERKGFVDATMSDIAAEAGISKPTVYQYVDSKNWLLEKIVQQVIYPLRDGLEVIVASDASALEKLEQYVRLQVNSAIRYRTYYAVLIADQHQLSDQALREYLSWARDVNQRRSGYFANARKPASSATTSTSVQQSTSSTEC